MMLSTNPKSSHYKILNSSTTQCPPLPILARQFPLGGPHASVSNVGRRHERHLTNPIGECLMIMVLCGYLLGQFSSPNMHHTQNASMRLLYNTTRNVDSSISATVKELELPENPMRNRSLTGTKRRWSESAMTQQPTYSSEKRSKIDDNPTQSDCTYLQKQNTDIPRREYIVLDSSNSEPPVQESNGDRIPLEIAKILVPAQFIGQHFVQFVNKTCGFVPSKELDKKVIISSQNRCSGFPSRIIESRTQADGMTEYRIVFKDCWTANRGEDTSKEDEGLWVTEEILAEWATWDVTVY